MLKRILFVSCIALTCIFFSNIYAEENEETNLILYVSNQSFYINPVDIKVYVDGELIVDEEFDVTGKKTPQHNRQEFRFKLSPGVHVLSMKSKKGEAALEKDFEIKTKHWAVIEYWYNPKVKGDTNPTPKSFTFDIKDGPIGFR